MIALFWWDLASGSNFGTLQIDDRSCETEITETSGAGPLDAFSPKVNTVISSVSYFFARARRHFRHWIKTTIIKRNRMRHKQGETEEFDERP